MQKLTYTIEQDEYADSPREWDNLGIIVTAMRNHDFGDERLPSDCASLEAAFNEHLKSEGLTQNDVIALPVFAYIHSGITINTCGFGCPWDSGQSGWIYVSKKKALAEFGGKIVTKKLRDRVELCLNGEIETMDQYLNGYVYSVIITDEEGEIVESCGGYYGYSYAESEAIAMITHANAA